MSKNKKHNKRNSRRTKRAKKQTSLSKVLSCSKQPFQIIKAYFTTLTPNEVKANVSKIARLPIFSQITNLTLIKDYKWVYAGIIPDCDLEVTLNWAVGIIIYHHKIINRFTELEDSITQAILNEQFDYAIELLDKTDDICGLSSWSVAIRGSVYDIANKHDASIEFIGTLEKQCNSNPFFLSICQMLMERYDESSLVISSGTSRRNSILRSIDGSLQSFLIHKIVPKDFSYDYKINYEHILNYEVNASIIDIFKSLIGFLSSSLDTADKKEKSLAEFTANALSKHINYYLLNGLCSCYGLSTNWNHDSESFNLIDLYSAGSYEEICNSAKATQDNDLCFTRFELLAKSAARTNDEPLHGFKQSLLSNMTSILLKEGEYQNALSYLLSLCHAFYGLPWFQELHYLLSRESGFISEPINKHVAVLSSAYSKINSPKLSEYIPPSRRDAYLQSCSNSFPNSLTVKLFMILNNKDSSLDSITTLSLENNRALKYKAKLLINTGLIHDAIPLLKELSASNDKIIAFESVTMLVDSLIKLDQREDALDLFVETVLNNHNLVVIFNTFNICDVAKSLIDTSRSISVPIALSLHSELIDSHYDSTLRYSFDKYIENNCFKQPYELIEDTHVEIDAKLSYFLEKVCTPKIMKLSLYFENKNEIEDFRIAVCTYLVEHGFSKSNLVTEIKEINKDRVIRKAETCVDQSRIYSDLSALKDHRSKSYRQIFDKYLEFRKKDYSSYEDEIQLGNLINSIKDINETRWFHSVHILGIVLNEKNSIFHKLIGMLRDEFTFGSKGLNSYLSTRIRHGVLPNTLRTCASNENLVTAINSSSGIPRDNEYWHEHLSISNENEWTSVNKALRAFTTKFENIISEINDEWLQITSLDQDIRLMQNKELKDKALFDYSISNSETYYLQSLLADDNYETFIKIISAWLLERTSNVLEVVHGKITEEAKDKLAECYSTLSSSIIEATHNQESAAVLLDAISRSKDHLNNALNIISTWFSIAEVDAIQKFDITTAVEIAAKTAKLQPNFTTNKEEVLIDGQYLNNFVDILYILFENAESNSSLNRNNLKVETSVNITDDNIMHIKVTNNCTLIEDIEIDNKRLDYYRDAYGNEDLINDVVQKEGGTGLFKIWKILSRDLEADHSIDFGYKSPETFSVNIILNDIQGILA